MELDAAEPKEEGFLSQGSGSHFESRVAELVVITPSATGLARLHDKVEQLVEKGFHNIVVSLARLQDLGTAEVKALSRSRQVVDTWAGTLRLSEASANVQRALSTLSGEDAFDVFPEREAAIDAYRASMTQPLDPGESQDLLIESGDSLGSEGGSEDWGWGAEDASATFPTVPIAEVFVSDNELLKLDNELRRVVMGGKRHVSLRVTFSRPLTSDDVSALTGARDYLAREDGQLVLVSLPLDVLKQLRMLDLERELLVVEGASEAEELHQRHFSGEAPQAAPAAAPKPAAASKPAASQQPAASELELQLDPISSVELDSGISLGLSDGEFLIADGGVDSAEVARLRADCERARDETSRAQQELGALRARLQAAEGQRDQAHLTLNELQASIRRSERRIAELEQAQSRAERRATEAESVREAAQADTRRLDGELGRLRQSLDEARDQAGQAQAGLAAAQEAAVDPARISALEADVRARDAKIAELAEALDAKQRAMASRGDDGDLRQRLRQLEDERAKVLTEAEAEIQRLSDERQALREELESAGEMIERLGKELELS